MTQLDRLSAWVLASEFSRLREWARKHHAKAQRRRVKKAPSRAVRRADGVARMNRTAEIREALVARAGGLCEVCGAPGSDLHHCISGGGKRRPFEALDTVVLVCRPCHDAAHRSDPATLSKLWAVPGLSGSAMSALEQRMVRASR